MSSLPDSRPAIDWTRWFAAGAPQGGWRLLRFERVDANTGQPVGKPQVALTPSLRERTFRNERLAELAAEGLNIEEDR
ncbi:hypothetical protein [Stenotrophomonas sp. MMGLT7]|uniref:hypothetical protein n=1 Tax=Stenotrophomonas sp. MMGLT7 TaxID=2901227 RepID=UPI001E2CDDBD|nr:hypothetical protein [Stenotrophomonas sp. MMGLT7]MCD7096913.1 hypothetical protein [Stenotrophomonas sp. MMGLT7]